MLLTLYRTIPLTLFIGRRHDFANSSRVIPSTPGPRLFEAAGCGAAQLVCDSSLEIGYYYEPNVEFLSASNIDEAVECLERASKDSGLIDWVAQRAWKRTQSEHFIRIVPNNFLNGLGVAVLARDVVAVEVRVAQAFFCKFQYFSLSPHDGNILQAIWELVEHLVRFQQNGTRNQNFPPPGVCSTSNYLPRFSAY